jgi:hypothetical protein
MCVSVCLRVCERVCVGVGVCVRVGIFVFSRKKGEDEHAPRPKNNTHEHVTYVCTYIYTMRRFTLGRSGRSTACTGVKQKSFRFQESSGAADGGRGVGERKLTVRERGSG